MQALDPGGHSAGRDAIDLGGLTKLTTAAQVVLMSSEVSRGQLGIAAQPLGHVAHHAAALQRADGSGQTRAGDVVGGGKGRAVRQPGLGTQHVRAPARTSVGHCGDTAGNPAQLLMHRPQIRGVHPSTTHGVGGAEGTRPAAALAGVSAITMDCHTWPYQGMLAAEVLAGATICEPSIKPVATSPSITVNDSSPTRTNLSRSRACCSTYAGSVHLRCSSCRAATVSRCWAIRSRNPLICPCWLSVERNAGISVIASITKIDARMTMPLMDRGVRCCSAGRRPRAAAAGRVAGLLADVELPARDEAVRRGVFGVPPGRRVVATVAAPIRPCRP